MKQLEVMKPEQYTTPEERHIPKSAIMVLLHPEEIEFCEIGARGRHEYARSRGYDYNAAQSEATHVNDIDLAGCLSEYACALTYNLYLPPFVTDLTVAKDGDLPLGIEVKSVRGKTPNLWDLNVTERNLKDDRPYINVITAFNPRIYILGIASGKRVRQEAKRRQRPGAKHSFYCLPYTKLVNPDELIKWIAARRTPRMEFQEPADYLRPKYAAW